ncbi:MAG: DUF4158 domain-containing protein [Pseudomonadales bacterium]|nr:DUF4158 domain-containing protein [Pseudomonadales bacterium]
MKSQANRLSILSLPEAREVYSVPQFNAREREHFFTFTAEELDTAKGLHSHRNRIHYLLMLGYFSVKKVCLTYQWKDIEEDYRYIAQRYYSSANKQKQNISRLTRSRLYKRVLHLTDYQRCDKQVEAQLFSQLENRVKYYIDPAQLFHDAITFLKSKHVAVPRYSTIQKLISKAINSEETRLSQLIDRWLVDKESFLQLIDASEKKYRLNDLKKLTKAYKTGENKKEMERHQLLSDLFEEALKVINKLKLTEGNIRYFATRCQKYDIYDLRELSTNKSLIYLICFVVTRFQISNDILTLSYLAAYKTIEDQTKTYRDEKANQQAIDLTAYIEHVPMLLNMYVDGRIRNNTHIGTIRNNAFDIISEENILLVIQKMENIKPDKTIFKWEYIDHHFGQVTTNLRPLLMALDFGCRDNSILDQQIKSVKSALNLKKCPPLLDDQLIARNDRKYLILNPDGDNKYQNIMANRHEMYLYKLLEQGLRNGSIFVKNSLEYRSFDDYLVNDRIWKQRKKYLADIGLDWMIDTKEDNLTSLEKKFNERIMAVGHRISEGGNAYIKLKPNTDKLLWSRAVVAKDEALTERFFSRFIQKSIGLPPRSPQFVALISAAH